MKNNIYPSNHTTILTNSPTLYPPYQVYIPRHRTQPPNKAEGTRSLHNFLSYCLPAVFFACSLACSAAHSARPIPAKPSQSKHRKPCRQQAICYLQLSKLATIPLERAEKGKKREKEKGKKGAKEKRSLIDGEEKRN